ncbi:MAG TPA: tetratricopeptide repeat-containing diguanylate cyclase [Casimicrobiaceae bacterium]|nr:tetratricopeptide repeat-containing diguanylate cyclase [Casimicrobiaceae bacterium]
MPSRTADAEGDQSRGVPFWDVHFHDPAAALEQVRAVLAQPHRHDERTLAWAELTEGFHRLFMSGEPAEAGPWLASAGRRFLALGDRRGTLLADTGRARMLVFQRQPLAARDMLQTLLPDAKQVLAPCDLFWVLNTLSGTYFYTEQLDAAIREMYEALQLLRRVEISPQLVTVLSNLSAALVTVGDYAPARELAQEALDLLQRYRNPQVLLYARSNLAEALAGTGDWDGALATVDAMLADRSPAGLSPQNHYFAIATEVYARHGRLDDARRCAKWADDVHRSSAGPFNEAYARWSDACVAMATDAGEGALAALEQAAEVAVQRKHLPITCKAFAALSERCAALGRYEEAWRAQCRLTEANQQRLLNRASARYYLLRVEHELSHVREERDRETTLRQESEALNRQLAEVNAELSRKMREVEELQAQLALEAVHDPLTGLFNRRYLDAAMPALTSAAERHGTPLTLALIDLDHFKQVNDRHGHLAGDKVLRRIGKLLGASLRPSDIVARWGGEEFCVLFPATDIAGAATALSTLATRLRELEVEWAGRVVGGFTFSAALAAYGPHGRSLAELVGAADDALYAAKGAGRDRVLVAKDTAQ